MVERKFHAIGHGGFITERINNVIDVVYDCGTNSNISNLENKIDSHFPENTEINALFISHFHKDHINGIEHLLINRRITNLILPLMDNIDRIFYLRSQNISHNSFMGRLILNPISLVDDYEINNIIQVSDREDNDDLIPILLENLRHNSIIASGASINLNNSLNWGYKVYNYQSDIQWRNWRCSLSRIVIPGNSIDLATYSSIRGQIDNALQRIGSRSHYNRHSMALYSGPFTNNAIQSINNFNSNNYNNPIGALYLGDYLAGQSRRWNYLFRNYNCVWNNIKIVQVPHHGSGGCAYHQTRLYSGMDRAIIFAQNGTYGRRIVHPSLTVISYLNSIPINYNIMSTTNSDELITCSI